jgi:hypothetical protein
MLVESALSGNQLLQSLSQRYNTGMKVTVIELIEACATDT